ncbi:hypothetical protein PoB_001983500 [Plakobranchus ocellatus]|uniref:Uncharacterized protein n=1 Tax=Plakobranchus ocellatus TaxID=259542 RepID=A0AAV3ZDW1_9GAST|nr:hypothetical protein PoB_001983500 [Plakobranchus ocellatus]
MAMAEAYTMTQNRDRHPEALVVQTLAKLPCRDFSAVGSSLSPGLVWPEIFRTSCGGRVVCAKQTSRDILSKFEFHLKRRVKVTSAAVSKQLVVHAFREIQSSQVLLLIINNCSLHYYQCTLIACDCDTVIIIIMAQNLRTVIFLMVLIANVQLTTQVEICWKTLAGAAAGATAVAFGGPIALGAIGFGAGGIGAGSVAAGLMSASATTGYGGAVIAGLQSAGAAGLGAKAATAGAAAGYAASKYFGFSCD